MTSVLVMVLTNPHPRGWSGNVWVGVLERAGWRWRFGGGGGGEGVGGGGVKEHWTSLMVSVFSGAQCLQLKNCLLLLNSFLRSLATGHCFSLCIHVLYMCQLHYLHSWAKSGSGSSSGEVTKPTLSTRHLVPISNRILTPHSTRVLDFHPKRFT